MEATTENLRTTRDPGADADRAEANAERAWNEAEAKYRGCLDWDEISDALVGSEQYLTAAMLADNPLLIGKIVLAVRDAKVQRMAQREVYGVGMERMATDEQAAALAYIAWSRQ